MKDMLRNILHRFIYPTCLMFTVLMLLMGTLSVAMEFEYDIPVVNMDGVGLIFLFSLLLSCVNRIFACKRLSLVLRTFIHGIGFVADFGLIFLLLGGYYQNQNTGAGLLILGLIALLYFFIALITLIIYYVTLKNKRENAAYTKKYSA